MALAALPDEVRAGILRRIKDPADLPKFERFFKLMDKRLGKPGVETSGAMNITDVTMRCWKRVFGVAWPKTKPEGK